MTCRICVSPYRNEIERVVKKASIMEICDTFAPAFNTTPINFRSSLYLHLKNPKVHKILLNPPEQRSYLKELEEKRQQQERERMMAIQQEVPDKPIKPGSTEDYADRLLKMGLSEELMKPGRVTHKDIIGAQKLLIEKERVQNERDALKVSMARLMAGMMAPTESVPISSVEVKEIMAGEVVG